MGWFYCPVHGDNDWKVDYHDSVKQKWKQVQTSSHLPSFIVTEGSHLRLDPETKACTGQLSLHPSPFPSRSGRLSDPQREAGPLPERLWGSLFFRKGHRVCFWSGFAVSWSPSFVQREQSLAKDCSSIRPVSDLHFTFVQRAELSQLSWTFPRFTVEGGSLRPRRLLTFCS